MNALTKEIPRVGNLRLVRFALALGAALNISAGLLLLLAPLWFFNNVGDFGTFNRHYAGDAGAFVLALGVGLLLAWPNPAHNRAIIAANAISGLIHAANHLYDDFLTGSFSAMHFFGQTVPILVVALLLVWAYFASQSKGEAIH